MGSTISAASAQPRRRYRVLVEVGTSRASTRPLAQREVRSSSSGVSQRPATASSPSLAAARPKGPPRAPATAATSSCGVRHEVPGQQAPAGGEAPGPGRGARAVPGGPAGCRCWRRPGGRAGLRRSAGRSDRPERSPRGPPRTALARRRWARGRGEGRPTPACPPSEVSWRGLSGTSREVVTGVTGPSRTFVLDEVRTMRIAC